MSAAVQPVAGPCFAGALAAAKRTRLTRDEAKLLCTLAAYRDAGRSDPPVRELAARTGIRVDDIDEALRALIRRRLIFVQWSPFARFGPERCDRRVRWRTNRYLLLFDGIDADPRPFPTRQAP